MDRRDTMCYFEMMMTVVIFEYRVGKLLEEALKIKERAKFYASRRFYTAYNVLKYVTDYPGVKPST